MDLLDNIQKFLIDCGIDAEIRNDRKERNQPYIHIGQINRVKNRMQFWITKNTKQNEM